nr:hypothetical protein [Coxiella burnetii]
MSEAKYGDDRRHHRFPVFRFAHTGYWLKPRLLIASLRGSSAP